MAVVHYALRLGQTACGVGIHGGHVESSFRADGSFNGNRSYNSGIRNVRHVTIPRFVTCKSCRKSKEFKAAEANP